MRAAAAMLAAAASLAFAVGTARASAAIALSGEQVTENLVADLVFFYRHSVRDPAHFELAGGGTDGGIADVERGVSDGALVARALTPSDPPGLQLTPLALSGLCLVSNRENPVPDLTHAELQLIVAGLVTSWSEIPGARRTDPIVPVGLVPTAGEEDVFESAFVDFSTPIAWQPITLVTATQVRDWIEQTPAGFGYVDLALAGPLHVIDYEGVACTRQTIENGTYPARPVLGVVTRGRARGALARFLHWAQTSPVARRAIAAHYIPTAVIPP